MAKKLLAFGDAHFPEHHQNSVDICLKVAKHFKPDITVCLGDMLDCGQFSTHPPTFGAVQTDYQDDLDLVNEFLDEMQKHSKRLVMIEGNHEYRIDRWAAQTSEGRGAYSMLSPRINLSRGRKHFTYVPYGSVSGKYPHYKINSRIVAVHGWSYARNAARMHLSMSQGMSVLFGHCHRCDSMAIQNVWRNGAVVHSMSAGCLCRQVPTYGTGRPVEWLNAFIVGYLGRKSDSLYTVHILGDRCILPDGKEITA